jgi:predicted secreted acid phosphatase
MTTGFKWFRRSAEFPLITRYIYDMAARRVDAIRMSVNEGPNWVVSLDADETIFDNSLGQLENEYLGLGYVAERWKAWEARGAAKEIPGAIDFVNHVLDSGGKIAIISNRDADLEEVARQNLIRLGMRDDRRKVCILGCGAVDTQAASILDLPKTSQADARINGTPDLVFGRDYFLIPNPLYGSWQNNKP